MHADAPSRAWRVVWISLVSMPVPNTVKLTLPRGGMFAGVTADAVPGSNDSASVKEPCLEPTEIATCRLARILIPDDRHCTDVALVHELHSAAVLVSLTERDTTVPDSTPDPCKVSVDRTWAGTFTRESDDI